MWPFKNKSASLSDLESNQLEASESALRLVRHPAVRITADNGRNLLVFPNGEHCEPNDTALWILDQLEIPLTQDEIIHNMQASFQVDWYTAKRDLADFLAIWRDHKLVLPLTGSDKNHPDRGQEGTNVSTSQEQLTREICLIPGILTISVSEIAAEEEAGIAHGWAFHTSGFRDQGHDELILFVKRGDSEEFEDYPLEIIKCISQLHYLVITGLTLDIGRVVTAKNGPDSESIHWLAGLTFFSTIETENSGIYSPYRTVLPLKQDESDALATLGCRRLVNRIAARQGRYPPILWVDRESPPLMSNQELDGSLLDAAFTIAYPGVCVYMKGKPQFMDRLGSSLGLSHEDSQTGELGRVYLELPSDFTTWLNNEITELREPVPLLLFADQDPLSDACFSWPGGDRKPTFLPRAGSDYKRVTLNFVALLPAHGDEKSLVIEDGIGFMVQEDNWFAAVERLREGKTFRFMPTAQGLGLEVTWLGES